MIQLAGIERIFQVGDETVHALSNVNLTVPQGEYIAIMGPSGSGKSTLLNIVGLLDRPDKGVYSLEDLNTTELTDDQQASVRCHKIGFVFQFYHLLDELSVLENVFLPAMASKSVIGWLGCRKKVKNRAKELLGEFGLGHRIEHKPYQLSGGERQRAAIARALINEPKLLLADEPTGQLDSKTSKEIMFLLSSMHERGKTVIIVTHDSAISAYAKRLIRIKDGIILD